MLFVCRRNEVVLLVSIYILFTRLSCAHHLGISIVFFYYNVRLKIYTYFHMREDHSLLSFFFNKYMMVSV